MKFTISAFPVIQWVFHTLGMDPAQRIMGFLWLGSFVIAQQITANSNRRLNAIMETCPVKILLIRPPAPAHERTPAGKRGPAWRRSAWVSRAGRLLEISSKCPSFAAYAAS